MWDGNTTNLNMSTPRNYMFENKVYLLSRITEETCAYLIGDIATFVFDEKNKGNVLNFIINSPGGEVDMAITIISLMNFAKLNDITVNSFVFGLAGSAASWIAINANTRYISDMSQHFIHFGRVVDVTTKVTEIEKTYFQNKRYVEKIREFYLENTDGKLSNKDLTSFMEDERCYLSAEECLKYGLCDRILEGDLALKYEMDEEQKNFVNEFNKKYQKKTNFDKKIKKVKKK